MNIFREGNAEERVDYAENTLEYAEISTAKIDKKVFPMYQQQWN